ncbi:MAG: hypothetical protein R2689_13920 [Microthrixaceae bacterium]
MSQGTEMKRPTPAWRLIAVGVALATVAACDTPDQPSIQPTSSIANAATSTPRPATTTPSTKPAPVSPGVQLSVPATTTASLVNNAQRCTQVRAAATANPARFRATSVFNTPAACMERHPESDRWSSTWFTFANYPGRTDPSRRGELVIAFDAYGIPVYSTADATTTIKVYTAAWSYGHELGGGRSIPWNPKWKAASGKDAKLIILDPASGKEWTLWGVRNPSSLECLSAANLLDGYRLGTDLCTYTAYIGRNVDGSIADATNSDGFSQLGGRGMGRLLGMTLLPTLDEIERGSINHAINMETYATMFGPGCTAEQISAGQAGSKCGYAVAPATKLEWTDTVLKCGSSTMAYTDESRALTVPEGMRFVLNKTDAQIDAWLDAQGYVGQRRSTARIFAVALRDYGWIISGTSCSRSSMAVEGIANPTARERWERLGMTDPTKNDTALLNGLITSANDVVVLRPNHDTLLTAVR